MSTQAQIKANRQNAKKSTGPKTDEGKAVVSQNAVKHGLFAAEAVITGEDPADYEAFHDNFLAELTPVGMTESVLAERIISMAWRLQRAERMQNQVIENMIERKVTNPSAIRSRKWDRNDEGIRPGDPRYDPEHLALGRIAMDDWSYFRVLDRMLMYERRIENSMIKMMKELKRFKIMRRIELQDAQQKQQAFESGTSALSKGNLKKQTQFIEALMGAKSFMQRNYNNNPAGRTEENKANQSQFQDAGSDSAFEFQEKCL